jgi:hypothetical protein
MKALSVRSDYAMEILCGNKTIECRTWQTTYGGEILICSNAKKISGCIPSHALLTCTISDIVPFAKKHLANACMAHLPDVKSFAWILDNFKVIQPFFVKGALGLFDIDQPIEYISNDISDSAINLLYADIIV